MDLLDKMNDALDYIKKNLLGEIELEEAAMELLGTGGRVIDVAMKFPSGRV